MFLEFYLKSFLIDSFQKTMFEGIVYLHCSTIYFVCLFFIIKHLLNLSDLCSLSFYFIKVGIWLIGVKDFVAIHNCN